MKYSLLILFATVSFLFSCNDSSTNNNNELDTIEETAEDKALKAVENLPEYKEANVQINAMTNGKQSITCIIDAPTENDPNFYIQAGYNQESWFEPYFVFVVDAETFSVSIEDVIEGDVVSLDLWRKREKQR